VLLLIGCSPSTTTLRADATAYLEKLSSWGPVEAETARALERIIATEFVDQAEVLRQIADNSPRVRRHLTAVEQFKPRTAELGRIHERYVAAWGDLLKGYSSIESGLAASDQTQLAAGRAGLLRWRQSIRAVAQDVAELSERLGIPVRRTAVSTLTTQPYGNGAWFPLEGDQAPAVT